MATLSAAIVKHRVASLRDVEEALARQALYGGDLGTNLLEVTQVSETELTRVLAESLALEPAPAEELARPDDATLALVPAELARRHGVYPLEESAGQLVLAVSEPLGTEVETDLGFALGVHVVQKATLEVRLRQALARDYGAQLDLRFERLLAKLDGLIGSTPRPETEEQRPALGAWPLPQPQTVPPATPESGAPPPRVATPSLLPPYDRESAERDLARATTRDELLETFVDFSAQHFDYCALFAIQGEVAQGRDAHGPGRTRARMGELTLPLDEPSTLAEAKDSGEVYLGPLGSAELDLALARELERPIGRAVLLLPVTLRKRCVLILYGDKSTGDVKREEVRDVMAITPVVSAALERLILARKLTGATSVVGFGTGRASAPPSIPPLPSARSSAPPGPSRPPTARPPAPPSVRPGRPSEPPTPVERARALVEALAPGASTRRSEPPRPPQPPTAAEAAPAAPAEAAPAAPTEVAPAAARDLPVQANRVRESMKPLPIKPVGASPGDRAVAATAREPARVAAQVPALPLPPGYQPGPLEYPSRPPQVTGARSAASAAPKATVTVARVVAVGPAPARAAEPARAEEVETPIPLTRRSSSSLQRVLPPTEASLAPDAAPSAPRERRNTPPGIMPFDAALSPAPGSRPPSRPRLELIVEPKPSEDHTPEIAVSSVELGEDWEIEDGESSPDGKAPLAPASRYVHYGARTPRNSRPLDDPNLPSIIVDLESDYLALLERVVTGDEQAQELLVQMGAPAAEVLAARLPGPVVPPRPSTVAPGRPLVPSRSGPLLATLVRLGQAAVRPVIERTCVSDPVVRTWATRVLGELPWPESARAVAARFADDDQEVRSAALGAGRMLQADQDSRDALRQALAEMCADSAQSVDVRSRVASSLSALRDDRAVPALIALLEDTEPSLVAAAHRALVELAAQDFGPSRSRYSSWWTSHQAMHRIEWLMDALTHESSEIRRAAGEELKAVTKEYFGYYDDLPPAERASAQQRYREWWNSRGKALFG
jgi:hypothetical protein